jgi:hypothetical protein
MTQIELLAEPQRPADRAARFELGRGYALHLPRGPRVTVQTPLEIRPSTIVTH